MYLENQSFENFWIAILKFLSRVWHGGCKGEMKAASSSNSMIGDSWIVIDHFFVVLGLQLNPEMGLPTEFTLFFNHEEVCML